MDERFIDREVDLELSVGDFVVSGGELPAMLLIDAVTRWLPGVLGHEASAEEDSFSEGLLDCPHYTRPEVTKGIECLMSCSAGIMLPSLAGGEHRRSEEPWIADPICWVGST